MRSFTAKYRGRCGVCDTAIDPGDDCAYSDDEIAHYDCALAEYEGQGDDEDF